MIYLYTFKVYDSDQRCNKHLDTTTNFEEIKETHVTSPYYVTVENMELNGSGKKHVLKSVDDLEAWRIKLEREFVWIKKDITFDTQNNVNSAPIIDTKMTHTVNNNVKPTHYQNYFEENEWIDVVSNIPRYKDPEVLKGAIEFQVRKYLDRNGRKDPELQELKKGLYYYLYLVLYIQNKNKPVKSSEIHKILKQVENVINTEKSSPSEIHRVSASQSDTVSNREG
jgi:hypothetical protein